MLDAVEQRERSIGLPALHEDLGRGDDQRVGRAPLVACGDHALPARLVRCRFRAPAASSASAASRVRADSRPSSRIAESGATVRGLPVAPAADSRSARAVGAPLPARASPPAFLRSRRKNRRTRLITRRSFTPPPARAPDRRRARATRRRCTARSRARHGAHPDKAEARCARQARASRPRPARSPKRRPQSGPSGRCTDRSAKLQTYSGLPRLDHQRDLAAQQ